MDESQTELVAVAKRLCDQAHTYQLDKAGRPYVEHPRRVASYVAADNIGAVMAALLHDVLEDSAFSSADLADAGIPAEVIATVELLTRSSEVPGDEYYRRIAAHPDALEVKLADLADNTDPARLAQLPPKVRDRLIAKYDAAYARLGVASADGDRRRRVRGAG
jgi:(p)ppGpp synthase/HD superfamily hydrolase